MIDQIHSGGVEKIAIQQVYALNNIGTPASLVVLRETDITNHPFSDLLQKVPIVFLDSRLPAFLKISFKFPAFSFFSLFHLSYPLLLPWVVKREEFSIFLSHGTYTTFTSLALRAFKKIPFAVLIWDPTAYILEKAYSQGPIRILRSLLLPLAKLVDYLVVFKASVVLVAGGANIPYLKKLGVKRIDKLYPGINPAKEILQERGDFILMVTAWKEGKNPEYNLDLIEKLPSTKLVMAGSWYPENLQEEFRKKVVARNLESRVIITGSLSELELNHLYTTARVFVQTNDDRGFGMPALEAASQGCPFIIPESQGVGELFTDGQEGFFTKERDTKQVLEKLTMLLNDKKKATIMGRHGWEKVINNYSWEKHALTLVGELSK